jgi:hypothetical protein
MTPEKPEDRRKVIHENWGRPSGGTDFLVDLRSACERHGVIKAKKWTFKYPLEKMDEEM